MFASRMVRGCGLDNWATNSEVIRAVADKPEGPYTFTEVGFVVCLVVVVVVSVVVSVVVGVVARMCCVPVGAAVSFFAGCC